MEVSVSQLRAELSTWIQRACDGEDVVITDRGIPVVRLAPVGVPGMLERLQAEGVITPPLSKGPRTDPSKRKRITPTPGPPISDFVVAERDAKR